MTLEEMWQAAKDFWRGRSYSLKEYTLPLRRNAP